MNNMEKNLKQQILEIRKDFYKYCERNLKIIDLEARLVRLLPNSIQRQIIDYTIECLIKGKPIRAITLKARKEGVSTIIEALIYWWTATHKYIQSHIVAHERPAALTIYEMFLTYYDNSDPVFQPSTKYRTRLSLNFNNPAGTGLNSTIATSTADTGDTGRSQTVQWLHGSEVAFWPKGEKLAAGLLQTVPLRPNTAIFLESTANGAAGWFYQEWLKAKKGRSIYKPFFFAWFEHDEYRLPVTEPLKLTEEEKSWKETYGLEDEQINWYRMKSLELEKEDGDRSKMQQEFPFNDIEAFLASGRARFDIEKLVLMEKFIQKPRRVDIYEKDGGVKLADVSNAPLKLWEKPKDNHKYVIGVDVAEGLEHGDYSVADVIDKDTMTTVARWHGQIEPADFGEILDILGRWYNRAVIGVEVNNHGLTVVQRLRDLRYDNLYRRERGLDERVEMATAKLGWRTDIRTKSLMIDALAEAINRKQIKDYDEDFIQEAKTYIVTERGKTEAQSGAHDDTVIAKAIALQMFDWNKATIYRQYVKPRYSPKLLAKKQRNRKLVKRPLREVHSK